MDIKQLTLYRVLYANSDISGSSYVSFRNVEAFIYQSWESQPGRLSSAPTLDPTRRVTRILKLVCQECGCLIPSGATDPEVSPSFLPSGLEEDLCLHEVQPLPPKPFVHKEGHLGQQVGPLQPAMGARSQRYATMPMPWRRGGYP